jgi:hypothetical protein
MIRQEGRESKRERRYKRKKEEFVLFWGEEGGR